MSAQAELELVPDKPSPQPPATAKAMLGLLRGHYLPDETRPAWIFAPEIQAPGPTQRKADLICLGCTAAAGSQLIGHEIKVTRADLLTELADLTKSDPWQRYCDRWWLVIPHASLIDGIELPDSWGVLTPPSGRRKRSMTIQRPAPQLKPNEQAPALRTLSAWLHWRLRDAHNRNADAQRRLERAELVNRQLHLERPRPAGEGASLVAEIIAKLGPTYGTRIGKWGQEVAIDDIVAALQDLGQVCHRRDRAQDALKDARRYLDSAQTTIARAIKDVDNGGES